MPVYNGQKYLRASIESILGQTFEDFELIIIDDGSQDQSLGIIREYVDPRIITLVNKANCGVACSLNKAIEIAQGKFIARMDADDIAASHRLETQVRYLEAHSQISLCGSWVRAFGEIDTVYQYPQSFEEIKVALLFYPCFAHPAVMWVRKHFIDHDLWYQLDPPTAEDYDLWVRASRVLKMANIPEVLLDYRIDMQVKHSPYLIQQTEGNWMVKQSLMRDLNVTVEAGDRNVFFLLSGVSGGEKTLKNGRAAKSLIERISSANHQLEQYDQLLLNKYLLMNFYGIFIKIKELPLGDWFGLSLSGPRDVGWRWTVKLLIRSFLNRRGVA